MSQHRTSATTFQRRSSSSTCRSTLPSTLSFPARQVRAPEDGRNSPRTWIIVIHCSPWRDVARGPVLLGGPLVLPIQYENFRAQFALCEPPMTTRHVWWLHAVLIATPGSAPGGPRGAAGSASARHELTQRMRVLKAYLETRGAALAHTPEFLAYYALPYVPQVNK